jgi:hypothetical protein
MIASIILLTTMAAPGAGHGITYAFGCPAMTPQRLASFKKDGIDFALFAKGIKDVPPPKYQIKWAPRPHPLGQGQRGTCTSWAFGYGAKSCLEGLESEHCPDSPDAYFSPSFIYSQRSNRSEDGMSLDDAAYILTMRGCVPYSQMPYLEATADVPPTVQQLAAAYTYRIADWMVIEPPATDKFKLALARDLPVVIGANVTNAFCQVAEDAVFKDFDPKDVAGGHAMCVVGYDDQRRAFRVLNSWGLDWADHGYVWISYDLFDKTGETDKRFLQTGVVLFDAPNLNTKVTTIDEGSGRYSWTVSVVGSSKALGQVETVEYSLPAGYEPGVLDRGEQSGSGDTLQRFVLRSADLQPPYSTAPVEIWARIVLKTTKKKMAARPIFVPCGKPREVGTETGLAAVPPAWTGSGLDSRSNWPAGSTSIAHPGMEGGVTLPDVTGLDSGMAVLRLMSLGLEPKIHHDPTAKAGTRAGTVLQQSPPGGGSVPKGTRITLTVP